MEAALSKHTRLNEKVNVEFFYCVFEQIGNFEQRSAIRAAIGMDYLVESEPDHLIAALSKHTRLNEKVNVEFFIVFLSELILSKILYVATSWNIT